MKAFTLACRFIVSRPGRSLVVILFVLLAVIAAIWTTTLTRSVDADLQRSLTGMRKMSADVVVLRRGSSQAYTESGNTELIQTARWIGNAKGVEKVSTQLRLFTYENSPWSEQNKSYVYAIDPASDLTVSDWLPTNASRMLGEEEVYIGNKVKLPDNTAFINLAGVDLQVTGRLEKTGTNLDDTLFVTFPTAQKLGENFSALSEPIVGLEANFVPVFMVKLIEGTNAFEASTDILKLVPGVSSFEANEFYRSGREQLTGLIRNLDKIFLFVWVGALVGIATVFMISLNERRREIGVLRVLGATRGFAQKSLVIEGLLLALGGALPGVVFGLFLGKYILPKTLLGIGPGEVSMTQWLSLGISSLMMALISVVVATIIPIWWVFRHDPAVSMRG